LELDVQIESVNEAIKFLNFRPKLVALYLFSDDERVQELVLDQTSSGGVTINDAVIHVSDRS
jgi:acyl-CoA reductase-like NAD-dependent aldehyde dehydrogenase